MDFQEFCPTPQCWTSILWCWAFFIVQLSHPYLTTGKTTALTRRTFVGKVMSLLFNQWHYMRDSKKDTDVKNRLLDSVEEGEGGWFERIALQHVYYHMWNRSPVQVQCMRQGTQSRCTGMTLRDGMGREVGEGFRMGDTCTPMADSCECMAKTTTVL